MSVRCIVKPGIDLDEALGVETESDSLYYNLKLASTNNCSFASAERTPAQV